MSDPKTIQATEDLLDGWRGPVLLSLYERPIGAVVSETYESAGVFDAFPAPFAAPGLRVQTNHGTYGVGDLRLDLSVPEVRDRVARVLAERVGLEVGPTSPLWVSGVLPGGRGVRWSLMAGTGEHHFDGLGTDDPVLALAKAWRSVVAAGEGAT